MISDWGSIRELIAHGVAKNESEAALLAMTAGSDIDLEGRVYEVALKNLAEQKKIDIKLLDDAVRRTLRLKFRLGLFDDPYRDTHWRSVSVPNLMETSAIIPHLNSQYIRPVHQTYYPPRQSVKRCNATRFSMTTFT